MLSVLKQSVQTLEGELATVRQREQERSATLSKEIAMLRYQLQTAQDQHQSALEGFGEQLEASAAATNERLLGLLAAAECRVATLSATAAQLATTQRGQRTRHGEEIEAQRLALAEQEREYTAALAAAQQQAQAARQQAEASTSRAEAAEAALAAAEAGAVAKAGASAELETRASALTEQQAAALAGCRSELAGCRSDLQACRADLAAEREAHAAFDAEQAAAVGGERRAAAEAARNAAALEARLHAATTELEARREAARRAEAAAAEQVAAAKEIAAADIA